MLSDRMKKIKVQVLRLWGKGQRYVEKELGLILALFLLNWFTICYLNLQHYKDIIVTPTAYGQGLTFLMLTELMIQDTRLD